MKVIVRLTCLALFVWSAYGVWASQQWDTLSNEIGVTQNCRQLTQSPDKPYECLVRFSDGELGAVIDIVASDADVAIRNIHGKKIEVSVKANKFRKKRKRYTFIKFV